MSTPQKFDTARLACTATEGAKAKEAAYHEAYKGAPLRGKYRVGGTTYTKGSNKGSGNAGTYCVEEEPGYWVRYTVRTEYQPVHTTRSKGACDAPEIEEG